MNWKEKIEAQIALLKDRHWRFHPHSPTDIDVANSLLALLDVAVAADAWRNYPATDNSVTYDDVYYDVLKALDKLREVSDGS